MMHADFTARPKRLLMTADTVGGVWTYALELARELGAHGVEVALATMGAPLSREQWAEARQITNLSIFESGFKLEWMEEPWHDVRAAGEWLLGLESRLKPDLVHLNSYAHGSLPWAAPCLVVGHSCVLSWWRAVKNEAAPAQWNHYRAQVERGLKGADCVVAPTAAMMTALEEHYGALPVRRVVPNGRAPERFAPGTKEVFVLSAGRLWDEAKNVAALARVAPQLPWPVYVAGEEKHPGGGGVAQFDNVHFLGRLSTPALASWYARAALYALPARYEPFGLSVLEAALAGCALVLGDIPSLRENWSDAALFVPPDDGEALAVALRELMTNYPRRRSLAERARRHALQFTPQRMARGYLEVYAELLRRGRRVGRGEGRESTGGRQRVEELACAS